MLIFQAVIGGVILGRLLQLLPGEPPDPAFLVRISIFSVIATSLFTIAYLEIGDNMSINGAVKRALIFGMFFFFSNYLPQSMGLYGAGGQELIMSFSARDAIFDFFSYLVTFLFMGWMFRGADNAQRRVPKQFVVKAMLSGGILFPALMVVSTQAIGFLFPSQKIAEALRIDPDFLWSFYCSFYLLFILTGVLVPLLYYYSDFNRAVANKEIWFALRYTLLLWIPIVFAMVAFGIDVLPCLVFSAESVAVFMVLMKVCGRILDPR